MTDNEHYIVELFDWITETSPYDLLVPMPNNSFVRRSIEQVAEPYIPGYTGVLLVVLTYYYYLGFLILTRFAFIAILSIVDTISNVNHEHFNYGYPRRILSINGNSMLSKRNKNQMKQII